MLATRCACAFANVCQRVCVCMYVCVCVCVFVSVRTCAYMCLLLQDVKLLP